MHIYFTLHFLLYDWELIYNPAISRCLNNAIKSIALLLFCRMGGKDSKPMFISYEDAVKRGIVSNNRFRCNIEIMQQNILN